MKLYPSRAKCCLPARPDKTAETTVREVMRERPAPRGRMVRKVRAKQIHHWRQLDGASWWHWSDHDVVHPPLPDVPA